MNWIRHLFCALVIAGASWNCTSVALQCETNEDCAARAVEDPSFSGSFCANNLCVHPGTGGTGGTDPSGCVSNEQCTNDNDGMPARCVGGVCERILNEDCTEVIGTFTNDDAIFIGVLRPANEGPLPDQFMHLATQCVFDLAHSELEDNAGGLPGPDGDRPLVLVVCDETDAVRAATHLVERVGVKVLLGPHFADPVEVATQVTVPHNALHVVPAAGAETLATLADNGLVWTLKPSHDSANTALQALLAYKENELRANDPSLVNLRLVLYVSDKVEDELAATGLLDILHFNGKDAAQNLAPAPDCPSGCFRQIDGAAHARDFGPIVDDFVAFNPHVAIVLDSYLTSSRGGPPFSNEALPAIEELDSMAPASVWLFTSPDVFVPEYVKGFGQSGFAQRVFSVSPLRQGNAYQSFRLRYGSLCPEFVPPAVLFLPPSIEHWYDALYLAAYAHLAAGNHAVVDDALGGAKLAAGLLALSPAGHSGTGVAIDVGPNAVAETLNVLVSGGEVNLRGASSELDFDAATGAVTDVDMDIMCMSSTFTWQASGLTWDAATDTLSGTLNCP